MIIGFRITVIVAAIIGSAAVNDNPRHGHSAQHCLILSTKSHNRKSRISPASVLFFHSGKRGNQSELTCKLAGSRSGKEAREIC